MNIAPLQRHVKASELPLDKLAGSTQVKEADKVPEVIRQFEAVLLRHILSNAEKTVFSSKLKSQSASSGIYQDMIANELADQISRSGGFGLAHNLQHQLAHELNRAARGEKSVEIGAASHPAPLKP